MFKLDKSQKAHAINLIRVFIGVLLVLVARFAYIGEFTYAVIALVASMLYAVLSVALAKGQNIKVRTPKQGP